MDETIGAKERLKSICMLSTRIQSEIDAYVVEMRVQYPTAQFPSIDAHELTGTICRLQVNLVHLLVFFKQFQTNFLRNFPNNFNK